MAIKDKIFPGDTYLVSFEARRTNPDNPHDSYGLPATVVSATVTLLDGLTGEFVDLGGPGILADDAQVTPPSGSTGSLVSYLLSNAFTAEPGSFRLFVRCVFDDGIVLTEDRSLQVNEYR